MELKKEKNVRFNAYMIFLLAASFYMYEFILQVAPSVMAEPMMRTFNVTAQGFGIISAFYFYAYAPMQLPAGLLFAGNHLEIKTNTPINEKAEAMPIINLPRQAVKTLSVDAKKNEPKAHKSKAVVINFLGPYLSNRSPAGNCIGA